MPASWGAASARARTSSSDGRVRRQETGAGPQSLPVRIGSHLRSRTIDKNRKAAIASFDVIATGDAALAHRIISPDFVNREAEDDLDQPDRLQTGPEGFLATATWLRGAFQPLSFEDLDTVAEGDKVVVTATMCGRHTGSFQNIPATGREFRQAQIHVFTCRDGMVVDHVAQRDDLGLLLSLGWRPGRG